MYRYNFFLCSTTRTSHAKANQTNITTNSTFECGRGSRFVRILAHVVSAHFCPIRSAAWLVRACMRARVRVWCASIPSTHSTFKFGCCGSCSYYHPSVFRCRWSVLVAFMQTANWISRLLAAARYSSPTHKRFLHLSESIHDFICPTK